MHTPGPWLLQGFHIYGPKHPLSKHRNGRVLIAEVKRGVERDDAQLSGGAKRDDWSEEDDAQLIAAAPAMYRACKMLLSWLREIPCDDPDDSELIAALEDAIAKAEGRL